MEICDVMIIGGGPAGLNAALYAVRKELATTVVSTDAVSYTHLKLPTKLEV